MRSATATTTVPQEDGWFDFDPGTDASTNPLFYAPDLVADIADVDTRHEICTHTFSHIPCDKVKHTVVDWELDRCIELHEDFGLAQLQSLVTPWHRDPPLEVLLDNGIDVLRVPNDDFDHDLNPMRKFYWYLFRKPSTV